MPDGTVLYDAEQLIVCSLSLLEDYCHGPMQTSSIWNAWTFLLLTVGVGGFLWFRKYRICKKCRHMSLDIIMNASCNKKALSQLSRKDIKIQIRFWKENLDNADTPTEIATIMNIYSQRFILAPLLVGKYEI